MGGVDPFLESCRKLVAAKRRYVTKRIKAMGELNPSLKASIENGIKRAECRKRRKRQA